MNNRFGNVSLSFFGLALFAVLERRDLRVIFVEKSL